MEGVEAQIHTSKSGIFLVGLCVGFVIGFFVSIGLGAFSGNNGGVGVGGTAVQEAPGQAPVTASFADTFVVNEGDFYRGDKNAEIVIYEYSDLQCPFCARFHGTAQSLIEDNKNVAWVYRHLPLPSHALARPGAVLSECIKSNGSLEEGWEFIDTLFEKGRYTETDLFTLAGQYISAKQIEQCTSPNSEENNTVTRHLQEAREFGFNGTPNGVIYNEGNGKYESLPGAIPRENIDAIIETLK